MCIYIGRYSARVFCLFLLLSLLLPEKADAKDTIRFTYEWLPVTSDQSLEMRQLWAYGSKDYFTYMFRTNKDEGIDTATFMVGPPALGVRFSPDLVLASWVTGGAVLSTNHHLEPISYTAELNLLCFGDGWSVFNAFQGRWGAGEVGHLAGGKPLGDAPDTYVNYLQVDWSPTAEFSLGAAWRYTAKLPAHGDSDPWHTIGAVLSWTFYQPLFLSSWVYAADVSGDWLPGMALSIGVKLVE